MTEHQIYQFRSGEPRKEIFTNEQFKHHSIDGPSVIYYDKNGLIRYTEWWIDGKQLHIQDWCELTNNDPLLMKVKYS